MNYSREERTKIKAVLKAFDGFIKAAKDYDILYTKKAGYVWVYLDGETAFVIESAEELVDTLVAYMYAQVCCECDICGLHGGHPMPGYRVAEARHRLCAIFETIEVEHSWCYEEMECFFATCRGEM